MSVPIETPDAPAVEPSRLRSLLADRSRWLTSLAPVWTLIVLVVFFRIDSANFLNPRNLNNILVQISTWAIFATGMTFVLLTGEIDLSIAATAALSAMIAAK